MTAQEHDRFNAFLENWLDGIDAEAGFWDGFIRTRAGDYPPLYKRMFDPSPDFLHADLARDGLAVLDVGAGPISLVGVRSPHPVTLRACDALAPIYSLILKKHGVTPYVPTEFALVERLAERYGEDAFDLVCMSNALDHSFNPMAGVCEMLRVVKPGGTVRLEHYANEAEAENYEGLHQWNIDSDGRGLRIWNKAESVDVSARLGACCSVTVRESEKEIAGLRKRVIHADLVKHGEPPREFGHVRSNFDEFILRTLFTLISPRCLELDSGTRSGYFLDSLTGAANGGNTVRRVRFKHWLCLRTFDAARLLTALAKQLGGRK